MSVAQYAQIADFFRFGVPSTARGALTDDQINAALQSASSTMDAHFRGRYALPLIAWGIEVTKYCCWLSAFELLSGTRGYNPASGADVNIVDRYREAMAWLNGVQRQAIHPDVTPQTTQTPTYNQPTIITSSVTLLDSGVTATTRGW